MSFEPDPDNLRLLEANVSLHSLDNVTAVGKALAGRSGSIAFRSDGTMSAGIQEYLLYSDRGSFAEVPCLTLSDACSELGCIPSFIKMDIEGAEVAVIENARDFLREHPIHFAIESYHPLPDGSLTCDRLMQIFSSIGYATESSSRFGQMFTWARPQTRS